MVNRVKIKRPKQSKAVIKIKRQVADLDLLSDKNISKQVNLVNLNLFKI